MSLQGTAKHHFATSNASIPYVEAHLDSFIHWALQATSTTAYSVDTAIELLDQAWTAQKVLWKLREDRLNPEV